MKYTYNWRVSTGNLGSIWSIDVKSVFGWHTTLLPGKGSSELLLRIVHVHPRGHPSAPTTNTTTRIVPINDIFVQLIFRNFMLENDVYPFTQIQLSLWEGFKGSPTFLLHSNTVCFSTFYSSHCSVGKQQIHEYPRADIMFHLSEDAQLQHDATVNIAGMYLSELSLRKIQRRFDVSLFHHMWCFSFKMGALYTAVSKSICVCFSISYGSPTGKLQSWVVRWSPFTVLLISNRSTDPATSVKRITICL